MADFIDPSVTSELTIGELLRFLAPERWRKRSLPPWPPDVFALAMALLAKSGAYGAVLDGRWVPAGPLLGRQDVPWADRVRTLAAQWRERSLDPDRLPPRQIATCWRRMIDKHHAPVESIEEDWDLCCNLLALTSIADEACAGAGFRRTPARSEGDDFRRLTALLLNRSSDRGAATLCREVHPSKLQVLPKLHTPQSGLTVRSLSHHLALCPGGAVEARWVNVPPYRPKGSVFGLNLLVVPWPKRVVPKDFQPVDDPYSAPGYGLFRYAPTGSLHDLSVRVVELMRAAEKEVGTVDAVILPELALAEHEYADVRNAIHEEGAILVAGIRASPGSQRYEELGSNSWSLAYPVSRQGGIEITQEKHHRWRMDRHQIRQYGIGARLDPTKIWWEDARIRKRALWFVGMNTTITASVLICEDLARQEPVSELVRAVGPNLVIALLMDGPQLDFRWPARYATVLADDPGCSVLTVTSLGMARMSRSESGQSGSRLIALWKDDKDGKHVPIELPSDAEGVVLSLASETKPEWTADGRSGPGRAYYPTLVGINAVSRSPKTPTIEYTPAIEVPDNRVGD